MGSHNGTLMWCPKCHGFAVCKGVNPAEITWDKKDNDQRCSYAKHNDIQYFKRGRACLDCGHEFITGEVDIQFLNELADHREVLNELKQLSEESREASKTLKKLTKSLESIELYYGN